MKILRPVPFMIYPFKRIFLIPGSAIKVARNNKFNFINRVIIQILKKISNERQDDRLPPSAAMTKRLSKFS